MYSQSPCTELFVVNFSNPKYLPLINQQDFLGKRFLLGKVFRNPKSK